MRLLFECTYVFDHPLVNSGIQRVVRNVVRNLATATPPAGVSCLPVVLKAGQIQIVRKLTANRRERALAALQQGFERRRNAYWLRHHQLDQRLQLARHPRLQHLVVTLFRLAAYAFILPHALGLLLLAPGRAQDRARPWFERLRQRYWHLHQRLEQGMRLTGGHSWRRLPRALLWRLFRLGSVMFELPWRGLGLFARTGQEDERLAVLRPQPGDVLVLLDSSWHADFFQQVEALKQSGMGVVAVVYDLIPLSHPQFCDEGLVKVFDHWFDWVARTADGYIAISQTIAAEVRADIHRRLGEKGESGESAARQRWYGHFPLGSELDLSQQAARPRAALRRLFDSQRPVYLMVSTIEPRKNHAYLLDAFEILWRDMPQTRASLCIVGRIGWKCAPLIARIRSHPELGRRLFMFNDLDDSELEYSYRHSRALVFPSFVEGFGLPLVEAMQRGLPAMASDIAVFREIGAEFLAYFRLDDPASLARQIEEFETCGQFPARRPVREWSWPGWAASTQTLIERIVAATTMPTLTPTLTPHTTTPGASTD